MVDELRRAGDVVFSLAAVDGVRIVGCVVFSKMPRHFPRWRSGQSLCCPSDSSARRQSLDSRRSLARCEVGGWAAVFVLGNPAYYGRFGFRPDRARGSNRPASARISWRWRWGAARGRRTAASGICPRFRRAAIVRPARPTKLCRHSWTDSERRNPDGNLPNSRRESPRASLQLGRASRRDALSFGGRWAICRAR